VTAEGTQWVIRTDKEVEGPEILYTKIAFAMHVIYSDEYTSRLVEKVAELGSENGFYEGIVSDGTVLQILSDKTNSMILQAAAYARAKALQTRIEGTDQFALGLEKTTCTSVNPVSRRHINKGGTLNMLEAQGAMMPSVRGW